MFTQPSSGVLAREFHPKIGASPLRGEECEKVEESKGVTRDCHVVIEN
jgi:hypothetical protein